MYEIRMRKFIITVLVKIPYIPKWSHSLEPSTLVLLESLYGILLEGVVLCVQHDPFRIVQFL